MIFLKLSFIYIYYKILRDRTIDDKFLYFPNGDKQKYLVFRLELLVKLKF